MIWYGPHNIKPMKSLKWEIERFWRSFKKPSKRPVKLSMLKSVVFSPEKISRNRFKQLWYDKIPDFHRQMSSIGTLVWFAIKITSLRSSDKTEIRLKKTAKHNAWITAKYYNCGYIICILYCIWYQYVICTFRVKWYHYLFS